MILAHFPGSPLAQFPAQFPAQSSRALQPLRWLLLGASLCLISGCNRDAGSQPAPAEKAVSVRVATISDGPATPPLRTHGITLPKDGARLSFKVGGVIAKIAVNAGDSVRQGQLLARIEQTEVAAQVERAAQAATKARRNTERGEKLFKDQVITLEQVQDLRTAAAVAEAELKGARFNQGYALIEAPFDGVVTRRLAEERELVQGGQPILVLSEAASGFVIRAAVSDREVVQVRPGDRATVSFDAYPGQIFGAEVSEIASAANEQTGMFDLELSVNSETALLKSGLVASVELAPSASANQRLAYVPFSAVVNGHERSAVVYVLENGRAVKREVTVAFIDREDVAVSMGVHAGETVITEGALFVLDGSLVRIVEDNGSVHRLVRNQDFDAG